MNVGIHSTYQRIYFLKKLGRTLKKFKYVSQFSSWNQIYKNNTPNVDSLKSLNDIQEKFDILNIKRLENEESKPLTHVYLQVIGSGSVCAPRALYVHTSNDRFLFNCGEGTTRIANEYKRHISKVSGIFITSSVWENVSGIPSLQDYMDHSSKHSFKTYGPKGMRVVMDTFSRLNPELASLEYIDAQNQLLQFENSLNIEMVLINLPEESCWADRHERLTSIDRRTCQFKSQYVVAYICKPVPNNGFVDSDLLVKAGVPPGPMVHSLRAGFPVTLPDGRVVIPAEVTAGKQIGGTFIVIEIPHVDYLESLLETAAFGPYQSGPQSNDDDLPAVIVHFSPPEVMKDPRYLQWVETFSPSVSHLVINERTAGSGLASSVKFQLQLNRLFPDVFPLLRCTGVPFVSQKEVYNNERINPIAFTKEYKFSGPTIQGTSLLKYNIRPLEECDSEYCPIVYPDELLNYCFEEEVLLNKIKTMNEQIENLKTKQPTESRLYPNITFLGTGSAYPSPLRNTSCILITADPSNCFLLDCGLGSYHQMVRLWGLEEARVTLRRLRMVYVSHTHRDHHLGLLTLLLERQKAFKEVGLEPKPLYLLAAATIHHYLKTIDRHFVSSALWNVTFVNNVNLVESWKFYDRRLNRILCRDLDLKDLSLTFVHHIKNACGVSITHNDGWKITYSGDTMPFSDVVRIGVNSDLLIHEATFENGLEGDARNKRHSTVAQAVATGIKMKAKHILLTHFSQRYFQVPLLEDNCPSHVGVAFDNMRVTLDHLPYMSLLYPPLKELFYGNIEKNAAKNLRKLTRQQNGTT